MSGGARRTMRDLVEEAKKRFVLLLISVFGLAYLMSLTSSSVWVNLPAAAMIFIFAIYLAHEFDIRRKSTTSDNAPPSTGPSKTKSIELLNFPCEKFDWKKKVNSPPVEAAIEQFTRHLVSEWVTDLWYSRITPDRDGPKELIEIINGVIGEISSRARDVNLIDLLTRDVINLISDNLELYRYCVAKIGKNEFLKLPFEQRDVQLKMVLINENKLHPALYSPQAEHKVLQHLMNGFISLACKPEDLQCSFFRNVVRELLACVVIRPVVNLVNPRFINERIESLVLSHANKSGKKAAPPPEEAPIVRRKGPLVSSEDQITGLLDQVKPGVELMQFKQDNARDSSDDRVTSSAQLRNMESSDHTSRIHNASSLVRNGNHSLISSHGPNGRTGAYSSGSEKAYLDAISGRKIQALAPENFDDMWTKGRMYTKMENSYPVLRPAAQAPSHGISKSYHGSFPSSNSQDVTQTSNSSRMGGAYGKKGNSHNVVGFNGSCQPEPFSEDMAEPANLEEAELDSENSYSSEVGDDDDNVIMGIDSPGTRIWESKNKNNAVVSHIRHPLETFESSKGNKGAKGIVRHSKPSRTSSARKRFRLNKKKIPTWQEVERTSFLVGDHLDILNASEKDIKTNSLADHNEREHGERLYSGNSAASLSSIPTSESSYSISRSPDNFVLADAFLKLRCEVVGANIVKSGTGTFTVYCISVTDANNNNWSIKRRFRHFEELHRLLKEFPEYDLHLPPKHFLYSGLDEPVIEERCKLLDIYLKKLLQLPTVSGSIEVWDFLSVDSQAYSFSDSLSIIQTLPVNFDSKRSEMINKSFGDMNSVLISSNKNQNSDFEENPRLINEKYYEPSGLRLRKGNMQHSLTSSTNKKPKNLYQDHVERDIDNQHESFVTTIGNLYHPRNDSVVESEEQRKSYGSTVTAGDSFIPIEWVPPNLTIPILNLVDIVFQLKDGGWIRRKAFWIAKQLLQLGMGDAVDDWLIEKIQLLRRGTTIASAINRIEHILWPDGIFITKHPKRKPKTPVSSQSSQNDNPNSHLSTEQHIEDERRAKFVYELIMDKAPVALVSLFGRKEYEQCAQDVYSFLQSQVCLKQMAFELLELLLLAAFPELDDTVRQCRQEEHKFEVTNGNS